MNLRGFIYSWVIAAVFIGCSTDCLAQVRVRGYVRKDGTYVQSHMRSRPDGRISNNWSTAGNVNPYTGSVGTQRGDSLGYGSSVFVQGQVRSYGSYFRPYIRSNSGGISAGTQSLRRDASIPKSNINSSHSSAADMSVPDLTVYENVDSLAYSDSHSTSRQPRDVRALWFTRFANENREAGIRYRNSIQREFSRDEIAGHRLTIGKRLIFQDGQSHEGARWLKEVANDYSDTAAASEASDVLATQSIQLTQ